MAYNGIMQIIIMQILIPEVIINLRAGQDAGGRAGEDAA